MGLRPGRSGWGNNELQNYTNSLSNASVADGKLTITARKENLESSSYTSARLVTKGKGDFLYGRFEIKAKLPTGKGTWPAIWMLPTDWAYGDWPKSGEIDIMEHVGFDQDRVHITVHTEAYNHTKGTQKGNSVAVQNASSDFHVYRIDWTPYAIRGYIDDFRLFEFVNDGKGYRHLALRQEIPPAAEHCRGRQLGRGAGRGPYRFSAGHGSGVRAGIWAGGEEMKKISASS